MPILSQRLLENVSRSYRQQQGVAARLMDIAGGGPGADPLAALGNTRRRRSYALQQSINTGMPYCFDAAPGVVTWIVALEDRRRIHGGLVGGAVRLESAVGRGAETLDYLSGQGMPGAHAADYLRDLPVWKAERVEPAAQGLQTLFYDISGWNPELLSENRLRRRQLEQLNRAIEDQRGQGRESLYAFEKERMLLANIRAGDRNEARRILNDMLAGIYMSSPELVVLRARTVEMLSYLTRAAIEDNLLLEPLIRRNHGWTEKLVQARSFEALSQELMRALDDFMDTVYLQGVNRLNRTVSEIIDFISRGFARPISLRDVAAAVGLSPCRVAHLVKAHTGRTVMQLIHQTRITQAQKLLLRTSLSCTQIAYEVGFGDQSYFIKHFKRLTGTTPMRYRRTG